MANVISKLEYFKRYLLASNYLYLKKIRGLRNGIKKYVVYFEYGISKILVATVILVINMLSILNAGLSINISGGDWNIGGTTSGDTASTDANKWNVRGSMDGTEDIDIIVTGSGSWFADTEGLANANNEFALRENNSSGKVITGAGVSLKTVLKRNQFYGFGLWYKAPQAGSEAGDHTLTVTLIAKNWSQWCASGYKYHGYCFYKAGTTGGGSSGNCDTVCSSHGGCDWTGIQSNQVGDNPCHICHHLFAGYSCTHGWHSHCHTSLAQCHQPQHCYEHHHGYSGCRHWAGAANWCLVGNHGDSHQHCGAYGSYMTWATRICACKE